MLTLTILRLTFVKSTRLQRFLKSSKPCHVGIHWIAFAEHSQMSTHLPRFPSFFRFLHHFVMTKLATSSIRVKAPQTWAHYLLRQTCIEYRSLYTYSGVPRPAEKWIAHLSYLTCDLLSVSNPHKSPVIRRLSVNALRTAFSVLRYMFAFLFEPWEARSPL